MMPNYQNYGYPQIPQCNMGYPQQIQPVPQQMPTQDPTVAILEQILERLDRIEQKMRGNKPHNDKGVNANV